MDKSGNVQWIPLKSILVIQDRPLVRKLICQNLEAYTGAEICLEYNAAHAIETLQGQKNFDLVISQNQIQDENTALKIYYTLVSQKLETPLIVLGENPKIANEAHCMDPNQWEQIIKKAAELMGLTSEIMANWKTSDYYPFPINRLSFLKEAPSDIFLKSQHGLLNWKNKGDKIEIQEVIRKVSEGQRSFFVKKDLRLKFTDFLSQHIQEQIQANEQSYHDLLGATSALFQSSLDSIQKHGLTSETLELCKLSINHTIDIAQNSPELELLFQILEKEEHSDFVKKNLLLSIFGHRCFEVMNLTKKSEHQLRHCFAAFFHDLLIPDEKLSSILTLEDLEKSKDHLNEQELQDIQDHAYKMTKLIEDQKIIPSGTANLILKHHAQSDGRGLISDDDKLTDKNIEVVLFIILERLIKEAFKIGGDLQNAYHSIVHFQYNQDQKAIIRAIKTLTEDSNS